MNNKEFRHIWRYRLFKGPPPPKKIKLGQFVLQKSQVPLSCKTTFEDERTKQLIIQNSKTHIDTATKLKVVRQSSVRVLFWQHTRIVLMVPTWLACTSSVNRLWRCSQRLPLIQFQNSILRVKSRSPKCFTCCTRPLRDTLFPILSFGDRQDVVQLFVFYKVDFSVPHERCLLLIDITCNANAGRCPGTWQYLVNSSKRSSGWYSTIRKTSLRFRHENRTRYQDDIFNVTHSQRH